MGRKKKPVYKIVASDARSPRDGRYLEALGIYDPNAKEDTNVLFNMKNESLKKWVSQGAHMTDTVKSLLKKHNIEY